MTSVVVVSRLRTEHLEADVRHSCLLSYGIDVQTQAKSRERSLGPVAAAGARAVAGSLVEAGALQRSAVTFFTAAQNPEECGYEGMKKNFVMLAGAVDENGLFVFHFSGHSFRLKNGQWALAPSDCDGTRTSSVTAHTLSGWLIEADCRAKHVLFTLDCCGEGAGDIAEALTTTDAAHHSLYVMSAFAANEASCVMEALGTSSFTYCLCYAINKHATRRSSTATSVLPLRKIFDECKQCSVALSTLLVRCEGKGRRLGLVTCTAEPELRWFEYQTVVFSSASDPVDETDSSGIGRFEQLTRHYDPHRPAHLCDSTTGWLRSLTNYDSPLSVLRDRGMLRESRALDAVLCLMAYSVASLQLAGDPSSVREPTLFITGLMEVVSTTDMLLRRLSLSRETVELCGRFYREALACNNVDTTGLDGLLRRILGGFGGDGEASHSQEVRLCGCGLVTACIRA